MSQASLNLDYYQDVKPTGWNWNLTTSPGPMFGTSIIHKQSLTSLGVCTRCCSPQGLLFKISPEDVPFLPSTPPLILGLPNLVW